MKMSKEDLQNLKDKPSTEILNEMKAGKIDLSSKDKEYRKEFTDFVAKSPAERAAYLSSIEEPAPVQKTETPAPVTPATETKTEVKVEKDGLDQPGEWFKTLGYESPESAFNGYKSLAELTQNLKTTVDSLNAKEGKRGQELKALKEEKERLTKEIETIKASVPAASEPTRPKRPNPKDFEDGAFDPKYISALDEYDVQLDKYEKDRDALLVQRTIASVEAKIVPKVTVPEEANENSAAWNKLFEQDIPGFQERTGLTTTVPIKQINDSVLVLGDANADPQAKAMAKAFLDATPDADKATYEKIKTAVNAAYTFDTGAPVTVYNKIESALIDRDMVGEGKLLNSIRPVKLTAAEEEAARIRARQQSDATVKVAPAATSAGADNLLDKHQNKDEKMKRMKDLLGMFNKAISDGKKEAFMNSDAGREYLVLKQEFTQRPASFTKG